MQTWPALRYLNAAMVSAAFSGSASANTTTGEWPPSSMVVSFMPFAASAARCLPTGIEPVNEILRTASLLSRYSETSEGTPNTRLSTPAGTPASAKQRTVSTQAPGVSSDAFKMSEQPAASAPPIFLAGVSTGKFHGVNAATTPIGSWITSWRTPLPRPGTMRPYERRPSSAYQSMMSAEVVTSARASG